MNEHKLNWPVDSSRISELKSGDIVYLSGTIYTARDAAHKRLVLLMQQGQATPLDLQDSAIFYAGPTPCPPGKVSGSIGPTTSTRMDAFKEDMMRAGMKMMIGKGSASAEIAALCSQYGAVYLVAVGGVAALGAQLIKESELVAWPELGAEAIYRLRVENFPLVVINDTFGNDYYTEIMERQNG